MWNIDGMSLRAGQLDEFAFWYGEHMKYLVRVADPSFLAREDERKLKHVFEGSTSLDILTIVRRYLALSSPQGGSDQDVLRYAAYMMSWAEYTQLVSIHGEGRSSKWRLDRPEVVYVAWNGRSLDVRQARAIPVGGRIKLEGTTRARLRQRLCDSTQVAIGTWTQDIDPTAPVPGLLHGPDFPPVETMGDLVDNLAGFIPSMPLWRLCELLRVVRTMAVSYPRPPVIEASAQDLDELNDFSL